ncbi:DUF3164 family protein [Aquincola tertiaricarbonis]|uniref:DUF3164 family protein n=1 Tax=Aquincola tertiaricarbonis TaxID=391953 RepID=A0ABY4S5Q6_AQUTE|nr:DUF3164 family protein [Aquincola tertiaricarbonis]URI06650.1 DUF3164 family protein [Aquincola tertiaricarbonis]
MSQQTTTETPVPAGYMQDAKGRLVPANMVKPIDKLRDQLVVALVKQATDLSAILASFKRVAFADIDAFVQTSAEQYDVKLRGNKGNLTLYSYDGRYKVVRQVADVLTYDERMQAAKQLLDDYITERVTEGAVEDDHYRDVMWAVCTVRSSAELDHTGRARFLAHLQACLRAQKPAAGAHARTPAARPITGPLSGPQRLMWSLWQQLADAGLVKHRGMSSLMRYAERQTSVARLEWLNSAQEELVIESLKLWLKRGGDGS